MVFNKEKLCSKCKYKGSLGTFHNANKKYSNLFCAYSLYEGRTALKRAGKGVIDTRGYDPENCLLFKKANKKSKSTPKY